MVPINGMILTLGIGQFKVKVKIEDERHIYILPAKHSYHYQKLNCNRSTRYVEYEVVPVKALRMDGQPGNIMLCQSTTMQDIINFSRKLVINTYMSFKRSCAK